jgi:hypothetical protein
MTQFSCAGDRAVFDIDEQLGFEPDCLGLFDFSRQRLDVRFQLFGALAQALFDTGVKFVFLPSRRKPIRHSRGGRDKCRRTCATKYLRRKKGCLRRSSDNDIISDAYGAAFSTPACLYGGY